MVTSIRGRSICLALLLTPVAACSSTAVSEKADGDKGGPAAQQPASHWSGKGFIVHEWGTNTIVVGSDGSLQRGLHHEEEDLPGFVYDRMRAGMLEGSTSVEVKMETPVTYFYSDAPRKVHVAVDFPQGVFTQWFPAVKSFYPLIAGHGGSPDPTKPADPVLDVGFEFGTQVCADKYGYIGNGLIDWGDVEVLARGTDVRADMPEASLDEFTWSYARAVDANAVRIQGVPGAMTAPETERFLFYRGLGNFEPPVKVVAYPYGKGTQGGVTLTNGDAQNRVGAAFLVRVDDKGGAFEVVPEGIPAGGRIDRPDSPGASQPIDAYTKALGSAMVAELAKTGLYQDEAEGMVNTWQRQWFKTPGTRVLYLAPQAWTDAQIPLTVTPAPDEVRRIMVIRVEVITFEDEQSDISAAIELGGNAGEHAAGVQHFTALGRFAEPRLRRAIDQIGTGLTPSAANAFLSQIATANTGVASGE